MALTTQPAEHAHGGHAAVAKGLAGQEHRHDGAHGRPVGDAQHVGTRQGIAEERLRGQPRQTHARADGHRQDDPRQADAQHDLRARYHPSAVPGLLARGPRGPAPATGPHCRPESPRPCASRHARQEDRQEEPDGQGTAYRWATAANSYAICSTANRSSREVRSRACSLVRCERATCAEMTLAGTAPRRPSVRSSGAHRAGLERGCSP